MKLAKFAVLGCFLLLLLSSMAYSEDLGTQSTYKFITTYVAVVDDNGGVTWEINGTVCLTSISDSTDEFDYATYSYSDVYINLDGTGWVDNWGFVLRFIDNGYEVVSEW